MIIISKPSYLIHKKESDGICQFCREIAWQGAEPDAENKWCRECENRSVVGIDRAITLGLVQVEVCE